MCKKTKSEVIKQFYEIYHVVKCQQLFAFPSFHRKGSVVTKGNIGLTSFFVIISEVVDFN